ncbi:MAG: aminoacyl-tRNA hydrolase [candidate division WOR-3 bacterium]
MIKIEEILIVHDDADLPFGKPKLKINGGAGGHKGISSIIYYLQTENFLRLKIGIGKEKPLEKYVLSEFKEEEKNFLFKNLFPFLKKGINVLFNEGINKAMNLINSFGEE